MEIHYYAGAADAAGTTSDQIDTGDLTGAQLLTMLSARNARLGSVLASCAILVDGETVSDSSQLVPATARVDILPPFAGG